MEKEDFKPQYHHQLLHQQSPYWNSIGASLGIEDVRGAPAYLNPYYDEVPNAGTSLPFAYSEMLQPKAGQLNQPRSWFYCLPRFRQAYTPPLNSCPKDRLASGSTENCEGFGCPNTGTTCAQKRFLVFDQAGDQTTLVYNPGVPTPVQCLNSWNPKHLAYDGLGKKECEKKDGTSPLMPFLSNVFNEENLQDVESDMHEDTEELNALLYSDDDDEISEDDEETSTGHSPSTMTSHDVIPRLLEEKDQEVASSARPSKRQKLLDETCDVPSFLNSGGSHRHYCSELEDDAESICGNGENQVSGGHEFSFSGKKRSRREIICERIRDIQSIIPCGSGNDAICVIDEAINYLRSLKVTAKSLGLDTL